MVVILGNWGLRSRYSNSVTVWTLRIQIPVALTEFSLLQKVQASSGTHPVCYSKGTEILS